MTHYDSADWHCIDGSLERAQAHIHIALYIGWLASRGLTRLTLGELPADALDYLHATDGDLSDDDMTDEGASFTDTYYAERYLEDYVGTLQATLAEVEGSVADFRDICRILDTRLGEWRTENEGSGLASLLGSTGQVLDEMCVFAAEAIDYAFSGVDDGEHVAITTRESAEKTTGEANAVYAAARKQFEAMALDGPAALIFAGPQHMLVSVAHSQANGVLLVSQHLFDTPVRSTDSPKLHHKVTRGELRSALSKIKARLRELPAATRYMKHELM